MTMRKIWRGLLIALLALPLFISNSYPATVSRAEDLPVRPEFKATYEVTELPLLQNKASRSWIWGPVGFNVDNEAYQDSPSGKRLVEYFDKGRLELNNPDKGVVTSGLLAKELMTGQVQLGDDKFETHGPSSLSVAGDPEDVLAPSYADLGLLFSSPAVTVGQVITSFIRADGNQSGVSKFADYKVTAEEYAPGEKHTIASVFKEFLNSEGLLYKNGAFVKGKLFESRTFATGLPLTEAYWARATIGGKVQDVLVQGFERRVLTYTPSNEAGFRVEAGNIGRHYYDWRYNVTELQMLSINDYHGRLLPEVSGGVARGGAAYLTTMVNQLRDTNPNTLLMNVGDSVGASQLASALLQDEPTIQVFNNLGFDVGTFGNHEFDKGITETLRLLKGGKNPVSGNAWAGANFPFVNANVVYKTTNKPITDPYVILEKNGIKVGVIGAVTKELPILVAPSGIVQANVLDEAQSINKYIPEMKQKGAQIIVAAIHEGPLTIVNGTEQAAGPIVGIAQNLDPAVDVIVTGHTHLEYVTYLSNKLVTQSGYYSRNVTALRLRLDKNTKAIISKRAVNVPIINSQLKPDPAADAIVQQAVKVSEPIANQKVSTTANEISRNLNDAGESAMGNLIADSQKDVMKADFAFMNPGGVRANQPAGTITYGSLFTIQPFGNIMVKAEMTGDQVYKVLEQQWQTTITRSLQISGFSYTWDNSKPIGSKIVEVRGSDGKPLDRAKTYTATFNNFLSDGGDAFTVFKDAKNKVGGPLDLDVLIDYIKSQPEPLTVPPVGKRITRLN